MKLRIYQVLHVASMVLLTGYLFQAFANPDPKNKKKKKKKAGMITGSLAVLMLIGGFGLAVTALILTGIVTVCFRRVAGGSQEKQRLAAGKSNLSGSFPPPDSDRSEAMKALNSFKRTDVATAGHNLGGTALLALVLFVAVGCALAEEQANMIAKHILARVSAHDFHPIRDGFTFDRQLDNHGVASLDDQDWRVRTLAVRDLVRVGAPGTPALVTALEDKNSHVRHVAAMVLGIIRATNAVAALETTLNKDSDSVVRSQAAIALGQIGQRSSLAAVQAARKNDKSNDVQHQAELAAYAIDHGMTATPELAKSYAALDESTFGRVQVGKTANDFQLTDTEGKAWRLSEFRGKKPVVLIWVFADWCPVCHAEFRELIELRQKFEAANIEVATLECHDVFPARVMVGKELEPKYWFSKTSFKDSYTKNIWWPHLVDRAGAVGAEYGVQPMTFAVHAEYINRPTVAIVDKDGVLRFLYQGTFWGDRPSIQQLLEMVKSGTYEFAAPKRLKVGAPAAK